MIAIRRSLPSCGYEEGFSIVATFVYYGVKFLCLAFLLFKYIFLLQGILANS